MENRRPDKPNIDKPFDRSRNQQRPANKPLGDRNFQPRDDRYRPKNDSLPARDTRFQSREGTQSRDAKFQPRENKFQRQEGGGQPRDNRYPPRDNRFQNKDNRLQGKPGKFDPKSRFPKKEKPVEPDNRPKVVSEMQITDGKLGGKYFQTTNSPKYRTTSRKLRETMFRLIIRKVRGRRFLDVCAGSGVVALEAISRGALLGTFVERSAKMCSFIRKNMTSMEVKEGHGEIFEIEAVPFLLRMAKRKRFWDVVFLDPSYDTNYDELLEYFSRGTCIKPKGLFVIEHHAEMFFPEKLGVLRRWRVVVEGDSALSFYERVA